MEESVCRDPHVCSLFRKCIVRHLLLAVATVALKMTIAWVLLSLFLFTYLVHTLEL